MSETTHTAAGPLAAASDALARGAWSDARAHFERALEHGQSAEIWEGLGWVGWYEGDEELTLRARELAYRLHRAAHQPAAAGRVAAWLAADHEEFRGEFAVARGWLRRAHTLLDGLPQSPDHGWLALLEASSCMRQCDYETAARLSAYAVRLGRVHGVPDLEAIGLAQEGANLVSRGHVADGTRCLDEAAAIAAGEEFHLPISPAWVLCSLITACDGLGDFPRAAQWSRSMREWAERWGARQILGMCRTAYGRVLTAGGDWPAAETELEAAVGDLEAARPGMAAGGLVRLAELRMRQGRLDDAADLLRRAGPKPLALVGQGELALRQGDAEAAADAAERVMRRAAEDTVVERIPALELAVRAHAARRDLEAAGEAAAELDALSTALGTPYLLGRAHLATAELALARGDHEHARVCAEDAVDRFAESSAPYDAAMARMALARALTAAGRGERAATEAMAARDGFATLGAPRDAERAAALLADGGPAQTSARLGELTSRELEVLRLVAQGLGDAEIAERLVVSPHTVHRHVANVRTKLRLPSRAAAVAYASRAGLL